MEFFQTTQLDVPLMQIMLLLGLSTAALLIGKIKLALLTNYGFVLYWGYIFNGDLFDTVEKANVYNSAYMGFGIAVVLLAMIGFIAHSR